MACHQGTARTHTHTQSQDNTVLLLPGRAPLCRATAQLVPGGHRDTLQSQELCTGQPGDSQERDGTWDSREGRAQPRGLGHLPGCDKETFLRGLDARGLWSRKRVQMPCKPHTMPGFQGKQGLCSAVGAGTSRANKD